VTPPLGNSKRGLAAGGERADAAHRHTLPAALDDPEFSGSRRTLASVTMLRSELKYAFARTDWESAKKEARAVMIERKSARHDFLFRPRQAYPNH
jgi:hypothetical protein